jgi:hypothetical protein
MQYMLLVYESEQWKNLPVGEKYRIHDACWVWHAELVKSGHDRGAAGLNVDSATTVYEERGKMVATDGPFAETKEVLGGYQTVECQTLDEAVAIAKTFPALEVGFKMEVRQVIDDVEMRRRYQA